MPRVTAEHRERRRRQILDAAMARFGDNGLHSTSMADVIAASGLSAGAVYLYFSSKDDLIEAVATEVLGGVVARLDALRTSADPVSPVELITALLERATSRERPSPARSLPLLLAVWSESTRNDAVLGHASRWIGELRSRITEILARWMATQGEALVPAEALAPMIMALIQGYILQLTLATAPPVEEYRGTVVAVLGAAGLA